MSRRPAFWVWLWVTVAAVPSALAQSSATASVVGYVFTANNSAVADAHVALRNTVSGQVAAVTRTNAVGEFTFNGVAAGSYVIEYQSAGGGVLALGHPFSVPAGATVATFVRMSNAVPVLMSHPGRLSVAFGGFAATEGPASGWSPGGGVAIDLNRHRAALIGEASVVRRDGHNDWRAIGGGRLWLGQAESVGLFGQVQAGARFRNGAAAFTIAGGAGVEWRRQSPLAIRVLAEVTNTADTTGFRGSVWLVKR